MKNFNFSVNIFNYFFWKISIFSLNFQIFCWNLRFYASDQKLLLVIFYVKLYLGISVWVPLWHGWGRQETPLVAMNGLQLTDLFFKLGGSGNFTMVSDTEKKIIWFINWRCINLKFSKFWPHNIHTHCVSKVFYHFPLYGIKLP